MLNNKYILVAGGCGYIGSNVVVELVKNGFKVVIVDNLSNSDISQIDKIKLVLEIEKIDNISEKFCFEYVDLTVKNEVDKLFQKYEFDGIILLAGLKAVGESLEYPCKYYRTNLNIATNLLELMEEYKCYKLIFSSSATVYGIHNQPPLMETDEIGKGIVNPYGYTKYNIETILQNLVKYNSSFKITSLRYFNPIGCHPSGLLTDSPKYPNNIVPVIINSIRQNAQFKVFGSDYSTRDGTAERDYINVTDLARAHISAYLNLDNEVDYQVYNVGTGNSVSVLELIYLFEKILGRKLDYIITDRRGGDVPVSYACCEKINKVLKWKGDLSLEQTIKDCLISIK